MTPTTQQEPVKIIGFRADGIRKLHAVEMKFAEKGLTAIKGKNKQGKSTVIDTVEWLLRGGKVLDRSAKNPEREKAEAELELGPYRIKRTMSEKSTALSVRNVTTNEVEKGEVQNFLDTFINELTFNPRALADLTRVEKYKFCMKLYNIDFTEIDKQMAALETDRLLSGRELKKYGEIEPVEPVERVNVQSLLAKKQEVETRNIAVRNKFDFAKQKELEQINRFNKEQMAKEKALEVEQDRYADLESDRAHINSEIKQTENEIKELQAKLLVLAEDEKKVEANLVDCKKKLADLPKPEPEKPLVANLPEPTYESTSTIDIEIQNAVAVNQKAELYESYLHKKDEKAEKELEYNALDDKIKSLREKKYEILRGIDTKVEGLTIGEDDIYYNGIGSENWSDSERLRITSELCVAMMPHLRAIFIDGAEEMDSESLQELNAWAMAHDIQVICTMVADAPDDEPASNCFFIHNGELV